MSDYHRGGNERERDGRWAGGGHIRDERGPLARNRCRDDRGRDPGRARDDRYRDDRQRDDRAREDRYRDDRGREDRSRDDRTRNDWGSRDDRDRDDCEWDDRSPELRENRRRSRSGPRRRTGDRHADGAPSSHEAREDGESRRPPRQDRSPRRTEKAASDEIPLIVSSCQDDTISDILQGTFKQTSTNHGRPVYKKQEKVKGLDVLIYFWDERDGDDLEGWWFGPNVGGNQVWAYHPSTGSTPPVADWKVPHDGEVDTTFSVTRGSGSGRSGAKRLAQSPPGQEGELDQDRGHGGAEERPLQRQRREAPPPPDTAVAAPSKDVHKDDCQRDDTQRDDARREGRKRAESKKEERQSMSDDDQSEESVDEPKRRKEEPAQAEETKKKVGRKPAKRRGVSCTDGCHAEGEGCLRKAAGGNEATSSGKKET